MIKTLSYSLDRKKLRGVKRKRCCNLTKLDYNERKKRVSNVIRYNAIDERFEKMFDTNFTYARTYTSVNFKLASACHCIIAYIKYSSI